jgi:membrane protein YdbS with pleckstrin-like domain
MLMELNRPHKRVRLTWTVYTLLAAILPGSLSFILFRLPIVPFVIARVFTALWIAMWLFLLIIYLPLRYRCQRYELNDDCIIAVKGVYFSTRRWMPMHAVRHITVIRGPLEKLFDFTYVIISAAGGWLILEGIPTQTATELRQIMRLQSKP